MIRDWFVLYRPAAPSARAQSVQVMHAAHALASLGHRVTLCVEPVGAVAAARVLEAYGLSPTPTLDLRVLPPSRTVASVAYRAAFVRFLIRTRRRGVVLARRKRHAAEALRRLGPFPLLVEAHEVDSALAEEAGRDPGPDRALEAEVLRGARGVVANCEGTLALLRRHHPWAPPAIVLHNAARPGAGRGPVGVGVGIGVVGSVRRDKDPWTVAAAAASTRERVHWVGVDRDQGELSRRSSGRLVLEAPLAPVDVPARCARFRALLVPLSTGLFGDLLTSPLKLWDALASGVPVVAADTPALRAAAGDAFFPYRPGDVASLVQALDRVCSDEGLRTSLLAAAASRARTWERRAGELAAFADRVMP